MVLARNTMTPHIEQEISQAEYERWIEQGILYDGTPPVAPADGFDVRMAVRLSDPESAASAAARAAFGLAGRVKLQEFGTVDLTGTTDMTDLINAALTEISGLGGGTLELPAGTLIVEGQIVLPHDGATPPLQGPLRLLGQGSHWSGQATAPVGGTLLDMRAVTTTGKIEATGVGLLSLEHLTLRDTSGDDSPFIHSTNTTLHTDHVSFVGSKTGLSCDQDAIVLGGNQAIYGQGDPDHGFQGYGTVISRCYFDGIRRGVVGQVYANALVIRDNTWWATCGNATGGAIEIDGDPTGGAPASQNSGALITGNLIEVPSYTYGVVIRDCNSMQLVHNQFYDADVTCQAAIWFDNSSFNLVIDGVIPANLTVMKETGTAVETNTHIAFGQSVASILVQPQHFYNEVRVIDPFGLALRSITQSGDQAHLGISKGANPYPEAQLHTTASAQVSDGVTTSGSPVITSATAAWTAQHIGLPISGTGIPTGTVIQSRQSATQVTLSKNATATGTGVVFNFLSFAIPSYLQVGFNRQHLITKGTIGAATPHANAGTGATCTATGTDMAFTVTLTTGTSPAAGQQATVGSQTAWAAAAKLQLTPKNAAAAAQGNNIWLTNTTTNTLLHAVAPLAASTTYVWDVVAVQ